MMIIDPYRFAAAGGGDPNFSSVIFLSGFEDVNPVLDPIDDESSFSHDLSKFGTNAAQNNSPKFGDHAAVNTGTGFWKSSATTPFNFGSGNWTVETWVYFLVAPSSSFHFFMGQWDSALNQRSWNIGVNSNVLTLLLSTNGSTTTTSANAAFTPTLGQYYHIAADYDGTAYRIYVDGVMLAKEVATRTLHASTAPFSLAAALTSGNRNTAFEGALDETRITKGVARYASDSGFTPPTAAFPRS